MEAENENKLPLKSSFELLQEATGKTGVLAKI